MENPATWNDIQKTINAACDHTSEATVQVNAVYTALSKAGMLAPSGDRGSACLSAIVEGVVQWQKEMEEQLCGLSLPSIIYHRLVKDSMLK